MYKKKLKQLKNILIANKSGFLGNSLSFYLKKKKYKVYDFNDRSDQKNYQCLIYSNFFISKNKNSNYKRNLNFAKKIINFLKKTKIDVIFISYHLPINIKKNIKKINEYQKAKYNIENLLIKEGKTYKFYVKILRFSNIYGPKAKYGVIPDLLKKMRSDPEVLVYNSDHFRDFLHIDDAVKIIEKFIKTKLNIRLYCGSGIKTQIKKLCLLLNKIQKKNTQFIFLKDKVNSSKLKLSFSNNILKKEISKSIFITLETGLKNL